ncbi:MAG: hypothetical protein Q4D51_00745 [Eubacteriales bacterium]|nr:hypothetical protein [Eubacteriales bacterium]
MTFSDYIKHYFSFPGILIFAAISFAIVCLIHGILMGVAKYRIDGKTAEDYNNHFVDYFDRLIEEYYEAMFSSSLILFFIGIYFLISYQYFSISEGYYQFWQKYEDYILLAFILLSILSNNLMDHFVVPLTKLNRETKGILRMASMLYMLVIFLFIKFIYQDNNYDTIIGYFLTLVIGRFVYFDASIHEFVNSVKKIKEILPSVLLVLMSSALLALFGFATGYLLKSNGVVLSLFIAHFFCILEIIVVAKLQIFEKIAMKMIPEKKTENIME